MAAMKTLSSVLPEPKYREDDIRKSSSVQDDDDIPAAETRITVKASGAPPYGHRSGWIPRSLDDYGDGGSFPEISIAQYPLEIGKKKSVIAFRSEICTNAAKTSSNALQVQVDERGNIQYDAIVRQGHDANRIIHTSMKDLVPLRQRVDVGEINLDRPSEQQVISTAERTRQALEKIAMGQIADSKPKNVRKATQNEPTYIRYTPANQMGERGDVAHNQRIIKMVDRAEDPMEPAKFRHRKLPRGPGSPPPPIMHSPPRKVTAKEQAEWVIPPSISNWKNPKGYTIPLDKRMAAKGQHLADVKINDNFAKLSEALYAADRAAREEVQARSRIQAQLATKEREEKEQSLQKLAEKARRERSNPIRRRKLTCRLEGGESRRRSQTPNSDEESATDSESEDSDVEAGVRERAQLRQERQRENRRKQRMDNMGTETRIRAMAREQNRDISEKIALGLAKPTAAMDYDTRLFNQSAGLDSGLNEDSSMFDRPLFAAQQAVQSIYRPKGVSLDGPDEEEVYDSVTKNSRFEVLGRAQKGFKGSEDAGARDGPVQFEKDKDTFGIDAFLGDVKKQVDDERGKRKMGLNRKEDRDSSKTSKRRRYSDDD
jgi:SNW domain-containing protein 1